MQSTDSPVPASGRQRVIFKSQSFREPFPAWRPQLPRRGVTRSAVVDADSLQGTQGEQGSNGRWSSQVGPLVTGDLRLLDQIQERQQSPSFSEQKADQILLVTFPFLPHNVADPLGRFSLQPGMATRIFHNWDQLSRKLPFCGGKILSTDRRILT